MGERKFRYVIRKRPRKILFEIPIYGEENEKGFDQKCNDFREELRGALSEEIKIKVYSYLLDSIMFELLVPIEQEEFVEDKLSEILEKYFPD